MRPGGALNLPGRAATSDGRRRGERGDETWRWTVADCSLLIASNNLGKLRELTELLADCPFRLVRPIELGLALDVPETGATYAENARLKALAYAAASGRPALADDSGLELLALGGWPGVHSVRFAGPVADDATRRALLLERLAGRDGAARDARFVCAVAVADGQRIVGEALGILEGTITTAPRGQEGFGYDPLFVPAGESRTLAELSRAEKNRLSHRARAIAGLRPALERLWTTLAAERPEVEEPSGL